MRAKVLAAFLKKKKEMFDEFVRFFFPPEGMINYAVLTQKSFFEGLKRCEGRLNCYGFV